MTSPVAATVNATGIAAPNFPTVLAYLISQYQAIFGADAYLGNDSQDGQLLGIFAQAISDCNSAAVAAYNSFSPTTAQGNGLSSNVAINGLTRLAGSFSTVTLTIVGVAGTVINNGIAQDTSGNAWLLPSPVTIPISGTINAVATAQNVGSIAAAPGTVTSIQTPVYGWQSVTNSAAATIGQGVETDAALRVRQAASVSLPSVSVFAGIVAAIEQVTGVTRVAGYENNTTATNGNGIPANNLAFVVEGNATIAVAQAIAAHIPPGIPTYATGTTYAYTVTDTAGTSRTINFMAPTESTIGVTLTLHALNGWSASTEGVIAAAIVAYLSTLPIGQIVSYTGLIIPAYLQDTVYAGTYLIKSMTINKNGGSFGSTDIALAFNEAPIGALGSVTFMLV